MQNDSHFSDEHQSDESMSNLFPILVVMAMVPFMVYASVKLGTYAFYRGRQIFNERHRNDDCCKKEA